MYSFANGDIFAKEKLLQMSYMEHLIELASIKKYYNNLNEKK